MAELLIIAACVLCGAGWMALCEDGERSEVLRELKEWGLLK